ncbi:MAG: type II toxin-antitoxin system RelE/ParE family toxin [Verrucomicrobia bacterium]|nr:type II toxin-antitoxin system RelE/ParE family toxin [Verrucomicrobiota bacterium]
MSAYRFTTEANLDLERICRDLGSLNPVPADTLMARIDEMYELLAKHPLMGRARPQLGEGLRSFPVGQYLVFYLPETDGIAVMRVLYGGRDLPALFQPPGM